VAPRLGRTIPALPVRDIEADFGTREFHTLDADGNLVTFFQAQ
jgi:hypothetical protein